MTTTVPRNRRINCVATRALEAAIKHDEFDQRNPVQRFRKSSLVFDVRGRYVRPLAYALTPPQRIEILALPVQDTCCPESFRRHTGMTPTVYRRWLRERTGIE